MTEVTDKMIAVACNAFGFGSSNIPSDYMRPAIEAALAAREPVDAGELVEAVSQLIRDYEDVPDATDTDGQEVFRRARRAAAAIEELVEALKPFAALHVDEGDYPDTDVSAYEGNVVHAASVRRARNLLTRLGVKL